MKILLSAFEPFGNRAVNQSWQVARNFIGHKEMDVVLLPVNFSTCHKILIEKLNSKDYDLIIMLGETSTTKDFVRLERVAINLKDSIGPDNDGSIPDEEEVIPNAPKAYFTMFPVKKINNSLKEKGYKVKITNSAGSFVCNSVYYNILHYLSVNNRPQAALFVHLPASTEIVSLNEMVRIVKELGGLAVAEGW